MVISIEALSWLLFVLAVIGAILNIIKIRSCFVIWIGVNVMWVAVELHNKQYPMAAQMGCFLLTSTIGYIKWSKDD